MYNVRFDASLTLYEMPRARAAGSHGGSDSVLRGLGEFTLDLHSPVGRKLTCP